MHIERYANFNILLVEFTHVLIVLLLLYSLEYKSLKRNSVPNINLITNIMTKLIVFLMLIIHVKTTLNTFILILKFSRDYRLRSLIQVKF